MASPASGPVARNLHVGHIDSRYTFREPDARKTFAILTQYNNMLDTGLLPKLQSAPFSPAVAVDEVRTHDVSA
jgi:hypothetical protein